MSMLIWVWYKKHGHALEMASKNYCQHYQYILPGGMEHNGGKR